MKFLKKTRPMMLLAALLIPAAIMAPGAASAMDYIIVPILTREASDLVDQVAPFLSPEGVVSADPGTNSLIIMDTPEKLEEIRGIITHLDQPGKSVRLRIEFLDVKGSFAMDMGADWIVKKDGFVVGTPGTSIEGDGIVFRAFPNATGITAHSVTTQTILVMSGSEARLTVGRNVPVRKDFLVDLEDLGYIDNAEVEYREVATGFVVTPTVTGKYIKIEIAPFMSYFIGDAEGEIIFYEASTSILTSDGNTVMIATNATEQEGVAADIYAGLFIHRGSTGFTISITPTIDR
ncbi:MAG: hypothetical protein JW885_13415 [Deltaproteobacteria bacterium]|nr:hypothetical protein [Candidatus Zymogenaceae bacterium]